MTKSVKRLLIGLMGAILIAFSASLAACSPSKVTITFDTNGGNSIASIVEESGTDITGQLPADPVKDGFVFDGWYTNKDLTGNKQELPHIMPSEDRTYYAKWAAGATLSLDAGSGGTLSATEYTVAVGADLGAFLENISPDADEGLEFAGWYNGDQAVGSLPMPEGGISLSAKYYANYTVNAHIADVNGSYAGNDVTTWTDKGFYGEPLTLTSVVHYNIDTTAPGSRISTAALEKDDVFEAYYTRKEIVITIVSGLEGQENFSTANYLYGEKLRLPTGEELFDAEETDMFMGYGLEEGGAPAYKAESVLDTSVFETDEITLYAIWIPVKIDFFGGSDKLAVDGESITLYREGLELKTGTYSEATGKFSFSENGKVMLEGKVTGDHFFYYDDIDGTTFNYGGETSETLVFGTQDEVTYTSPEGTFEGVYTLDPYTGEYLFEAEGKTFHFSLGISDGALVFNRENSAERGFYSFADGSSLLFLDGMVDANGFGGATLYAVSGDRVSPAFSAYYIADGSSYQLADGAGNVLLLFRITAGAGSVAGRETAGTYDVSDGYEGTYFDTGLETSENDLVIDGFGKATLKGNAGTYEIRSTSFTYESYTEINDFYYEWLVFTDTASHTETYFMAQGASPYYPPYYMELSAEPYYAEWADGPAKVYGSSAPAHAMYFYYVVIDGGNQAEVYVLGYDDSDDDVIYTLMDEGVATVSTEKEAEPGTFTFESNIYDTTIYDFKINEAHKIETSMAAGTYYDANADAGITVDKWGELSYGGKTYAYSEYDVEYIEDHFGTFCVAVYTVKADGTKIVVWLGYDYADDGETIDPTKIASVAVYDGDSLLEIINKSYLDQDDYFERIFVAEDAEMALITLFSDGQEVFVIYGDLTVNEDGSYSFAIMADYLDIYEKILPEEILSVYSEFDFKPGDFNGRTAMLMYDYIESVYNSASGDGSTLSLDGYSHAVYTPFGSDAITGTYDAVDSEGMLFRFSYDGGEKYFYLTEGDGEEYVFEFADDPIVGPYYYVSDGSVYFTDYIVLMPFDMVAYGEDYGEFAPTGKTIDYWMIPNSDPASGGKWTEYELTFEVYDEEAPGYETVIIRVAVATIQLADDSYVKVYMDEAPLQNDIMIGVEGGGLIYGDGYTSSYDNGRGYVFYGLIGIGTIYDGSPIASDYDFKTDFENGNQIIFYADFVSINGEFFILNSRTPFLFDFTDENRDSAAIRDDYNGTYVFYEKGAMTEETIYLDGHGHATRYGADGDAYDQGEYEYSAELDAIVYKSDDESFSFSMSSYTFNGVTTYIYYKTDEEYLYVGDDWSILQLGALREHDGSYINAVYVDARGVVTYGLFEFYTEDLVGLEGDGQRMIYFDVDGTSFTVNTETFIVRDNVLYAYQGTPNIDSLVIPEGVREIGYGVFADLGYIKSITFNNVEKIGDYAFYNTDLQVTELVNDKITYIGDYAFYVYGNASVSVSSLAYISLPACEYIGDYAFANCNSMSNDSYVSKLVAINHIGSHAFMHNYKISEDVMVLDLTEANLSVLYMDDDAFYPGSGTDVWERLGLPVKIIVSLESYSYTRNWAEGIQEKVVIEGLVTNTNPVEGRGLFSITAKEYLAFESDGANGMHSVSRYYITTTDDDYSTYNYAAEYGTYGVINKDGANTVFIIVGDEIVTFAADAAKATVGSTEYMLTGVEQTFTVKESGSDVTLTLTLSVDAYYYPGAYGGTDVTVTADDITYNGHVIDDYATIDTDFEFYGEYEDDGTIYEFTVNLGTLTSTVKRTGITVYTESRDYKALLSHYTEGLATGYTSAALYKKHAEDDGYDLVCDNMSRDTDEDGKYFYKKTVSSDSTTATYTVTLNDNANPTAITVAVESESKKTLTNEKAYQVTFTYTDDGSSVKVTSISSFKKWSGWWEEIYSSYNAFGPSCNSNGDNSFVITRSTTSWVITFASADEFSVEEKTASIQNVETAHEDGQDYYSVKIVVDEDGNCIGLGDEMVENTHTSGGGYSQLYIMIPSDYTVDGNTYSWSNFSGSYRVTVTKSDDGSFTVTVEKLS